MKLFIILGMLLGLAGVALLTYDLLQERTRQSILSQGRPTEGRVTGIVHPGSWFQPARITVEYHISGQRLQKDIDTSADLIALLDWEYEGIAKTPLHYLAYQPDIIALVADRDPLAPRRALDIVLLVSGAALLLLGNSKNHFHRCIASVSKSISPPATSR
ncbi:hypothetical protein EI77_03191 [Prosthecobacter fusiformis]|uniref:Uncharacterized protein n=1 Tax=Prosthecobacter fusiformis TaxID=48464 RepID=A0A4R7RR78_9BACT|nr:hypothetical protein [Prosthecobacter fusiformis]TDU68074.1 hypothetical protein EI77_03191 [Prosthecobacter fusiformis]